MVIIFYLISQAFPPDSFSRFMHPLTDSQSDQLKFESICQSGFQNGAIIVIGTLLLAMTRDLAWTDGLMIFWLALVFSVLGARVLLCYKGLKSPDRVSFNHVATAIALVPVVYSVGIWLPAKSDVTNVLSSVIMVLIGSVATCSTYHLIKPVVVITTITMNGSLAYFFLFKFDPYPASDTATWPIGVVIAITILFNLRSSKQISYAVEKGLSVIDKLAESNRKIENQKEDLKILVSENEKAAIKAENASRAKSVFLANISHEIRTPLNSVIGFSQILESDPNLPKDCLEVVERINKNGKHLLLLINDVLDMSKIEANRLELELDPCDLRPLLTECLGLFEAQASEKGIDLVLDLSELETNWVEADALKLRQVVMNLLSNALKFTSQGSVTLVASGAEGRARFTVKDTGRGISPAVQDGLFQSFEQCEASDSIEGTGLGLAISQGLVNLMGGKIELESEVGVGSAFFFEVQFAEAEPVRVPTFTIPGVLSRIEEVDEEVCTKPKVLIVDDIESNRILLKSVTRKIDATVLEAKDGMEAFEQCKSEMPTVILMDKRMPNMGGLQAAREIKEYAKKKRIGAAFIVLITADAFKVPEEFEPYIDDFVSKPFDIREVQQRLTHILNEQALALPC